MWAATLATLGLTLAMGDARADAGGGEVFERRGPTGYDIYLRAPSGETRRLTTHPADDRYPALSRDGSRVAFASNRDGDLELFVIGTDGEAERQITYNHWDDGFPAWADGDTQLVFAANPGGLRDLYVARLRDGDVQGLAREAGIEYEPAWPVSALDVDHQPTAWLETTTAGPSAVRFELAGTWDREEGRALQGRLAYGDGADTTFCPVPDRLVHAYAAAGTYRVVLYVQDSAGHGTTVYLELSLRPGILLRGLRHEDTREFVPRPLDR
ncbi:MAG: PKD domain-containing protein [Gemmatimonadota bacterium]